MDDQEDHVVYMQRVVALLAEGEMTFEQLSVCVFARLRLFMHPEDFTSRCMILALLVSPDDELANLALEAIRNRDDLMRVFDPTKLERRFDA
jgi:hypothetical protein